MEECLKAHNRYRNLHGVDALEIDKQLNENAQKRAESLVETGFSKQLTGENVYVTGSLDAGIRITNIVDIWYREGRYYKYGVEQPGRAEDVCHFTQMVWKDTKTIGVGLASDKDGNIYLVCMYEPAGNVEGMYADNVLNPIEESVTEPPLEESGIIYDQPPEPECVKSMERLYAVPSEELRVWSAWMTQVGVVAVEWQRWLQENIDLVQELNRRLVHAEYGTKQEEEADVSSEAVGSEESYVTAPEDAEMPAPIEEFIRGEQTREKTSKLTIASSKSAGQVSKGKSGTNVVSNTNIDQPKSMTSIPSNPNTWPLGSPWTPLGINEEKEATEETQRQVPSVPHNEDEMKEYMKEFNHQATLYRSYYKHWLETAEQATKEIGCRTVMPTWQVQGIDIRKGRGKSSGTTYFSAVSLTNPDARQSEQEDEFQDALENPDETTANEDKISKKSGLSGKSSVKNVSISEKAIVEPSTSPGASKSVVSVTPSKSTKSVGSVGASKSRMLKTRVTVTEVMKEMARADEDIPYFFYLKSLPDIDIAIEHDDEEVIEADPDRERIIGNCKQLFFNLCDKPGKDGKPWI